jgi:hypothetical protein
VFILQIARKTFPAEKLTNTEFLIGTLRFFYFFPSPEGNPPSAYLFSTVRPFEKQNTGDAFVRN